MKFSIRIKQSFQDTVSETFNIRRLKSILGTSLFVNAYYLTFMVAAEGAAGLVFWILAARFYSAEQLGIASAAIAVVTLLSFFSMLGTNWGLIRFLPGAGDKSRELINSCFTITFLVSLVISVIFLAGLDLWSPALNDLKRNYLVAGIFIVSTIAFAVLSVVGSPFTARRKSKYAMLKTIIFAVCRLALLIPMSVFFPRSGIFAAFGGGALIAMVVSLLVLLPRVEKNYRPLPTLSKDVLRGIAHFSGANYVTDMLIVAPVYIMPSLVINRLSAEANAYFYIAWTLGGLLTYICGGLAVSLSAEASVDETVLRRDVKRSLTSLIVLIPVILMIFFFGDKMLLIFGKAYSLNATGLFHILALSAIPISINQFYLFIKRVQKEMKSVITMYVFIALFTLSLAYLLLPVMGILGAGIAWFAANSVVALITGVWIYSRFIRNPVSPKYRKS